VVRFEATVVMNLETAGGDPPPVASAPQAPEPVAVMPARQRSSSNKSPTETDFHDDVSSRQQSSSPLFARAPARPRLRSR